MIFGESITTDGLSLNVAQAISLDEWTQAVEMISGLSAASPFWLGDLLELGERAYGENYAQGIPDDIAPATLRGYQWVSSRVPPANRHPALSWSHHRAISALPPVQQALLLDQAEAEGWSVAELGRKVKGREEPEKQQKVLGIAIDRFTADDGSEVVSVKLEGEWPAWLAADSMVELKKP